MATGNSSEAVLAPRPASWRRLGWLTLIAFTVKGVLTTGLIVAAWMGIAS